METMEDGYDAPKIGYSTVGVLMWVIGNLYYESCDNDNCMKKVIQNSRGTYDCEKCHKTFDKPKNRFMTNLKIADESGNFIAMASGDDICMVVFKRTIDELVEIKNRDEKAFSEIVRDSLFEEYRIWVLVKKEIYNNESKSRYQVIRMTPTINNPEQLTANLLQKYNPTF